MVKVLCISDIYHISLFDTMVKKRITHSLQNTPGNPMIILYCIMLYFLFTIILKYRNYLLKVYLFFFDVFFLQKYRYQDEDAPHDHTLPRLTHEVRGPELVHVSEKNLSQIENVHGYVLQSHISPLKVGSMQLMALVLKYEKMSSMKCLGNLSCCTNRQAAF